MKLEPVNYPVARINAPELADNAEFVAWLNQRTCATWHGGGGITEAIESCQPILVTSDPPLYGLVIHC